MELKCNDRSIVDVICIYKNNCVVGLQRACVRSRVVAAVVCGGGWLIVQYTRTAYYDKGNLK